MHGVKWSYTEENHAKETFRFEILDMRKKREENIEQGTPINEFRREKLNRRGKVKRQSRGEFKNVNTK